MAISHTMMLALGNPTLIFWGVTALVIVSLLAIGALVLSFFRGGMGLLLRLSALITIGVGLLYGWQLWRDEAFQLNADSITVVVLFAIGFLCLWRDIWACKKDVK